MKLLRKTQWLFLRISLPIFTVGGVFLFYVLRTASNQHTDERLHDVSAEIKTFVRIYNRLPGFFESANDRLYVKPLPFGVTNLEERFADTTIYNEVQKEYQPFRQIHFALPMQGQWWQATLMQSTIERHELALTVILLLLVVFGLLFLVLAVVNRMVSEQVWTPFFDTLQKMHRFRLTDPAPLRLEASDVKEFRELHSTLESLTDQVQKDFQMVKRFTENASHELQTPLAVIQNKVEMLLQSEDLREEQAHQIGIIGQSARRMARLNQALLLLAKIENHQFSERNVVALKTLVEKKLTWLEDFIQEKQLYVETNLADKTMDMNAFLAESLISNLLTNAVKHNVPKGFLHIHLDETALSLHNTATAPAVPIEHLADRFVRGNHQTEGVGLGLTIVSEICEQQGWHLTASFAEGIWQTHIRF